ncbi:hypothetical protein P2A57_22920 [Xanthomonas perforans]
MTTPRRTAAVASAVLMHELAWETLEFVHDPEDVPGKRLHALRLWMALVYVSLESWHETRDHHPSAALAAAWESPLASRLKGLRHKTFHYGGAMLPKEVKRFLHDENAVEWCLHVASELRQLVIDFNLAPEDVGAES